jgi:hypothetical protein
MNIFSWKVSNEELNNQVENYSSLKATQSYRGISAILIVASMMLTGLLAKFGVVSYAGFYIDLCIYLPLAFFVYKGHRWAIIAIMILWTYEKGYQLFNSNGSSPIIAIIWWSIFMAYFYNAFKVERMRRKLGVIK